LLSYRHAFHAGNLADVLKHSVLTALLQAAVSKPAPLLYLDTHAGAGVYELDPSNPDAEMHGGIGALRALRDTFPPASIAKYIECVASTAPGSVTRRYPGSAAIAAQLLRATDRLVLAERHPADFQALASTLGYDGRVQLDPGDGYLLLKSTLPPPERRGVVLVDPAYELADEPVRLIDGLRDALARFGHGVYLVWYPLHGKHDPADLKRHFRRLGPPKTLCIELEPSAPVHRGAVASGVWVVNPPYLALAELHSLTAYLGRNLLPRGRAACEWLIPE
jgi:23S rRNA (adenine2030-N6)-methyltransferase